MGGMLLADSQGLGKTIEGIATAKFILEQDKDAKVVVVCPNSVKLNWVKEFALWAPDARVRLLSGRGNHISDDANVYIINWDVLGGGSCDCDDSYCVKQRTAHVRTCPFACDKDHSKGWHKFVNRKGYKEQYPILSETGESLKTLKPALLICDEIHYAKASRFTTARSQRSESIELIARESGFVLGLTGTAILNGRPSELIQPLTILGAIDQFGGAWSFAMRYCDAYKDRFGWKFDGAANTFELNQKLRESGLYLRREKSEVLQELPDKTWSTVEVEMDPTYAAEYRDAEEEKDKKVAAGASRNSILGELAKMRKSAGLAKIKPALEWIADFEQSTDEKLIIFAHHHEVQNAILKALPGAARIFGEDSIKVRQENIERFQNDPECRFIVCSLMAAKEGITLTAASNVLFVELDWVPGNVQQASDRAHRIGQKNAVTIYLVVAQNTLDTTLAPALVKKVSINHEVLSGRDAETEADDFLRDFVDEVRGGV